MINKFRFLSKNRVLWGLSTWHIYSFTHIRGVGVLCQVKLDSRCFLKEAGRLTESDQVGILGCFRSFKPASAGVLLAFRVLQVLQQDTRFNQEETPPLLLGRCDQELIQP